MQLAIDRFSPTSFARERSLALVAATIVPADHVSIAGAITRATTHGVPSAALYEVVLQSYLFLGFPRMLSAADVLSRLSPEKLGRHPIEPITSESLGQWQERGEDLCQRIYGSVFAKLRERVNGMAPEIFEWMILEGYGKVLSRPGLSIIERELCIVSTLTMDNREQQLYAHMRGARNVGASEELLRLVLDDIHDVAPGHALASSILRELTQPE